MSMREQSIESEETYEAHLSLFELPGHKIKSRIRPWFIAGTLLLSAFIIVAPTPEGLTVQGKNAIAIFVLCLIFWVSNAIPLMITSILAIILLPLLNVMDGKEAYALFGNQAVFFILGAFILASAVMQSGLSNRIALKLLLLFQSSSRTLLFGLLVLPAALSFVMSEHAVAAMMFPIVIEIAKVLKVKEGSRYGLALILAATWGSIIGGIGTFLGGARAILAVGILEETTGETISFVQWALAAAPSVLLMLALAYGVLLFITRSEKLDIAKAEGYLQKRVSELGRWSTREIAIGVLMTITIVLWVFFGHEYGLANIALGAVVVAFIFKLLSWKQVEKDVNWGIILMYGGAIALGFALDQSGAALWLSDQFLGNTITTGVMLIFLVGLLAKIFTEGMSNTAVVALLMPIAIVLSTKVGLDPKIATLALAIPSGLAFMLPISTPATAIAVSSPYVTPGETMKLGLLLNIVSIAIFMVVAVLYWPLIGLSI